MYSSLAAVPASETRKPRGPMRELAHMTPFLALPFQLALLWFLRHEVGSLEFKVYPSLIFGYLGIFLSRRVPPVTNNRELKQTRRRRLTRTSQNKRFN